MQRDTTLQLEVLDFIENVLAKSETVEEAIPRFLEAVCVTCAWQWGALWTVDENSQTLVCAHIWHRPELDLPQFETSSRNSAFKVGVGLPGRVWASAEAAWISDVSQDANFPRRSFATEAGLHGACGFPVLLRGKVLGVMEFFSREPREPDRQLLTMMLVIGRQIGQFMDRTRSQRLLAGSEALNASFLETSLDCIVSMDQGGKVVEWNPAAEKTFGYSRHEAIGQEMAELIIPPRLREAHRHGLANYLQAGHAAVIGIRLEITGMRKDGEEFPVELAITRVPLAGAESFIGCLRDISQRKSAEAALRESAELLRLGLDAGNTGTWDWDIASNRVTWSDRVYELHGVKPGEFGGTVEEFIKGVYPEDVPRVRASIERCLATASPCQIEFRVRHPDGNIRWLTTNGRVFYDAAQRPVRVMGATSDITDRKLAEQERDALLESERVARTEAERASRLKDEFLATVSHELRTPLTAILGYAQLLRAGRMNPEDIEEAVEVIERNARAQTQIIEDLLDMSRIVSGKVRLDVQCVELPKVVEGALDAVRYSAQAKGVRLIQTLDPLVPPVSADPARLQQVVWNLLSNAIKFTPRGGKVHLVLARVNAHLEITVSDTGKGIAPDFLPYVFDKFRQGDASAARRHGGLGLGLSIVKSLVELHGGTITASSPGEGRGATFTVNLPVSLVPDSPQPEPPTSSLHAETYQRSSLKGVCVLAVDDEPDVTQMVRRILEDCGARVITATSAEQAIEALRREEVHVFLSDIGMPVMDGYELIRRIRTAGPERNRNIPAAALTAFARSEDRTRALMAGYQTHIAKPVEAAELIATVASLAHRTGRS